MKLNSLVAKTDRMRKLNAQLVKVVGYKTGFDKHRRPTAVAKTYTPKEYIIGGKLVRAKDQNKYVSSVKFLNKKLDCKVSCSCPDFMYRWEFALAQAGAADIIYGNGEPANETNPGNKPGLCVAEGTLVQCKTGPKKIEDVVEGDLVSTLLGWRRVLASAKTGRKRVVRVTCSTGHYVHLTKDHPVLTMVDGKIEYTPVANLSIGAPVFISHASTRSGKVSRISPEGVVAGLLISEGDEFGYAPVEPIVRSIFEKNYIKVFGELPKYKSREAKHILLTNVHQVSKKLGFSLEHSREQRIPKHYLVASEEFRVSLLYGLFLGDGNIDESSASYGTSSLGLAKDVQQLMHGLGIFSSIRKNGEATLWHVRVPPSSRQTLLTYISKYRFKYQLTAHSAEHPTNLERRFPVPLEGFVERLKAHLQQEALHIAKPFTYLTKVKGSQIPLARRKYGEYLFKVRLSSHKPTFFSYKEVCATIDRDFHLASYTVARVPALPGYPSKQKLRLWLNSVSVYNEQTRLLGKLLQDTVVCSKVASVVNVGTKNVYDLEVEEAEHFTANGLILHNCKHLVALRKILKERHGV